MPSFTDAFQIARKRNANRAASTKRFKEILGIIRKHNITGGLTPQAATTLLEDLGPTFVKLGQIASTHPDVLPEEYCDAFGKLRAHVAPLDADAVKEVVERELGKPIDELFSEFDDRAVGSASIAQAHRAVLRDGGDVVAVKVQRPHVVETVAEDLAIMERIVDLYNLMAPEDSKLSIAELVDELARTSRDELDFRIEARNLKRSAGDKAGPNALVGQGQQDHATRKRAWLTRQRGGDALPSAHSMT